MFPLMNCVRVLWFAAAAYDAGGRDWQGVAGIASTALAIEMGVLVHRRLSSRRRRCTSRRCSGRIPAR